MNCVETVVAVLPHALPGVSPASLCTYPLVEWLVFRILKRRMMHTQHWSRVESSELQEHWCMVGAAVKTDVEKGIM